VTKLFGGAPDLLEDFKQFLPESAAQAKAAAAARQQAEEAAILSNVRGDTFYGQQAPHQTPRADHRLPPVGNFAPTPTVNKDNKRKRGDRQGTAVSGMGTIVPEPVTSAIKQTGGFAQASSANKVSQVLIPADVVIRGRWLGFTFTFCAVLLATQNPTPILHLIFLVFHISQRHPQSWQSLAPGHQKSGCLDD